MQACSPRDTSPRANKYEQIFLSISRTIVYLIFNKWHMVCGFPKSHCLYSTYVVRGGSGQGCLSLSSQEFRGFRGTFPSKRDKLVN